MRQVSECAAWIRARCEPIQDRDESNFDLSYLTTALLLAQSSYIAAPDREAGLRAAGQALLDCGVLPTDRELPEVEVEIDLAKVSAGR